MGVTFVYTASMLRAKQLSVVADSESRGSCVKFCSMGNQLLMRICN